MPTLSRDTLANIVGRARKAFDAIGANLVDKEPHYQATITATFLAFCAASQLERQSPREQLAAVNMALNSVGSFLLSAGIPVEYGKGRNCAGITPEMVTAALDGAKKVLGEADLMQHRGQSRQGVLSERLLEFSVAAKLLNPSAQALSVMMSTANEMVAQAVAHGVQDRNVITLGK